MLHAAHAAHAGLSKITMRTVDTDVVLAVALVCTMEEDDEVWCPWHGQGFPLLGSP